MVCGMHRKASRMKRRSLTLQQRTVRGASLWFFSFVCFVAFVSKLLVFLRVLCVFRGKSCKRSVSSHTTIAARIRAALQCAEPIAHDRAGVSHRLVVRLENLDFMTPLHQRMRKAHLEARFDL